MNDEVAWSIFRQLRTKYQRLRKEAKEAYRLRCFTDFLEECKVNPRALWKKLDGRKPKGCPLRDVESWTDYFRALFGLQQVDSNHKQAE